MCTKKNQRLWLNASEAELIYFFHPDHLGSASWITDLSGRTVKHYVANGLTEMRLNVSDLPSGVYFVSVSNEATSVVGKFVVE
ncbi:MAG: T9SS type A sorting domain-containing protein [Bacteroidales bacterium]|nr:T9SS type A sorting domain-containing protein [Bacteroidales bacterium]